MTPPAMNTCSKKHQLPHPADQFNKENFLLNTCNFFTLPNMLDNHTYVHIIQQDTCLYNIQDLKPEDIAEKMRIKKQADKRRMRRIQRAAEIQTEKVKRLRRELQIVHKRSRTEIGELGIIWWNQEYWGTGFGVKRLGIKDEEPLTPPLRIKVEPPPTPPLTYSPSRTSVEMEYREILFRVETKHSDKELYQIIVQSRPVQMISY